MTSCAAKSRILPGALSIMLWLTCGPPASALVDPSLQPADLLPRYEVVLGAKVGEIDFDHNRMQLRVTEVLQGRFTPRQITFSFPPPDPVPGEYKPLIDVAETGEPVVALVFGKQRHNRREVLVYGAGFWHVGHVDAEHDDQWHWQENAGDRMWGTFNGHVRQLLALARDTVAGRGFMPSRAFVRFAEDRRIGQTPGPPAGVALVDLDRDGRLDIVAASADGVRVFLQTTAARFEDRTAALGLGDARGSSVGAADVNGDGTIDLLVDAVVYLNNAGRFDQTLNIPLASNATVLQAGFVELDGDGWPEIVIALEAGGLCAFRFEADTGRCLDITAECSLNAPSIAKARGYFVPGDWNGDGRIDLFHAAGKGAMLVWQQGRFATVEQDWSLGSDAADDPDAPRSWAGTMAPQWRSDGFDLVVPDDGTIHVVTPIKGKPVDVSEFGNEIRVTEPRPLATLVEDLNMDGRPDLYTLSRDPQGSSAFHCYRGYGTYMRSRLYLQAEPFPGRAHHQGAGGAAAGDIDGDGANDLVIAGSDGSVNVLLSEALSGRRPTEQPTEQHRILEQCGYLTIRLPDTRGAVGATVRIIDAQGRMVALRSIGTQLLTGGQGPAQTTIALREPGPCVVSVRFADGLVRQRTVVVEPRIHQVVSMSRAASTELVP